MEYDQKIVETDYVCGAECAVWQFGKYQILYIPKSAIAGELLAPLRQCAPLGFPLDVKLSTKNDVGNSSQFYGGWQ